MDTDNRWIVRTLDVAGIGGPADDDSWLSPAEQEECARWRDDSRRRDWLAGRVVLKSMIRDEFARSAPADPRPELPEIEILSADASGRGVRPRACVAGRWLPWQMSLAHCNGVVSAVIAPTLRLRVGIDVVPANAVLAASTDLWFADGERRWLQSAPGRRPQELWAIKEAVYKGTNCGEAFVPAEIEVEPRSCGRFGWSCRGRSSSRDDLLQLSRHGNQIVALVVLNAGNPVQEDSL